MSKFANNGLSVGTVGARAGLEIKERLKYDQSHY